MDEAMVRAVATFHFLTVEQVTRLFYHHGSLTHVRGKLKRLSDLGYLQRLRVPRTSAGNPPWVYHLARGGIRALQQSEGLERGESLRFRPAEQREHAYLFLAHTLAVNDVLIAATLLSRTVPQAVLAELQHERDLRQTPVRVRTSAGESMSVIPDAWLDFHLAQRARMSIVLELDRGTVGQRAFKRKLRGLLAYAAGPYQEAFGTSSLTIAIATTAGVSRAKQLRAWCEQVLRAQHAQQAQEEADLFLITSLPPGPPDPRTLFLSPLWWQPFATAPCALIDLAAATGVGADTEADMGADETRPVAG